MTEHQTVADQERERWLDKLCLKIQGGLDHGAAAHAR